MKKRNLNWLLALLAALALVFAAGCDDGTNGGSSSDETPEEENETPSAVITANAANIGTLLDAITDEVSSGITDESDNTVNWAFQAGAGSGASSGWDGTNATYTLLLANGDTASTTEQPILDTALASVQALGDEEDEDNGITVNFGSAAAAGSSQAAEGNRADYRITVPVTVTDSDQNTETGSIILVLKYETVSSATGGWLAHTAVTSAQVEGLLKSITDTAVGTNNTSAGEYWKFGSGTLTGDASSGYTFTVEPSASSISPSIGDTLANVRGLATKTATDSSCSIDFSNVNWDSDASPSSGSTGSGSIKVTVTAGTAYSVPSALQSVTITFTSSSQSWTN